MTEKPRQIFRQKSLDRLAAPDRLDQLLTIVRPKSWIALLASASVLALGVVWSVIGTIPLTADGVAMLIRPGQFVSLQSPGRGKVTELHVSLGDSVKAGDQLGSLHLPDLDLQLRQEKLRLEQTRERIRGLYAIESELSERELTLLGEQYDMIEGHIKTLMNSAVSVKSRSLEAVETQRTNLDETQVLSDEFLDVLTQRFDSFRRLNEEKQLVSEDQMVDLQSRLLDRKLRAKELGVSRQELELREILAEQAYDRQVDLVDAQAISLKNIEVQKTAIGKRMQMRELQDEELIEEIERGIELLAARLVEESRILSEHDGRIIELTISMGDRVDLGTQLGRLEIDDPTAEVMAVAYFRIEDGKKLRPGQSILVSPSTIERERWGGIVGAVVEASDYPVTTLAAAGQLGDLEVARSLLGGQNRIQVLAKLERDAGNAGNGFLWSSGEGPPETLQLGGTTARVRATIEERSPITFVLPFLRSVTSN